LEKARDCLQGRSGSLALEGQELFIQNKIGLLQNINGLGSGWSGPDLIVRMPLSTWDTLYDSYILIGKGKLDFDDRPPILILG
jgi:hypothetical protein